MVVESRLKEKKREKIGKLTSRGVMSREPSQKVSCWPEVQALTLSPLLTIYVLFVKGVLTFDSYSDGQLKGIVKLME